MNGAIAKKAEKSQILKKTYGFTHVDVATVLFILVLLLIGYLQMKADSDIFTDDWWVFIVLLLALLNVRFEVKYDSKK